MRLQNIILINRAPFDRLELAFDDENIVLLSGINGAGKTTILSYIVDAIYELAKIGYHNEFRENSDKFYRVSSSLFSLNASKTSIVYMRFVTNEGSVIDYIDIRGNISEKDYDSLIELEDKIPFSKLSRRLDSESVYKYWSMKDKNQIENLFSNSLLTYFPSYRYETPSYLNDPYRVDLKFRTDQHYSGYLINPIEVTSDLPGIANWVMDIVLDQEMFKGEASNLFSQINLILSNILLSKLPFKTRLGIGPRFSGASRIAVMHNDYEGVCVYPTIFNMSTGELALFCLFGELVKQTDRTNNVISDISGIVLIDEIEKHLHIKLQKEVLPKLISMFPNVQFIVSSHSPFLGLGLGETESIKYKILDLNNHGLPCMPQDNDLFLEVYNMVTKENERYYGLYNALREKIKSDTLPLVITEGKTDWKHIKAAKIVLGEQLEFDLYEYNDALGDKVLLHLLNDYARVFQSRIIIGVFDRDNFCELKIDELETQKYISFGNNVFAFAIPIVNSEEYGTQISIEHYYKRVDLTKEDPNGRRIFLGNEFYDSGISKNGKYHTRTKGVAKKVRNNEIIDEKVYDISLDPEEKNSVALSKSSFADLILTQDDFAAEFDFSAFKNVFDVIQTIILESTS